MKHILVIDDDRALLQALEATLTLAGYEVEVTDSGQDGLRRAYERVPDLILCDISMPDLGGTTVLQALRVDSATQNLQVVLMTGKARNEVSMRSAMDLGADDYLEKPFSPDALLRCVASRLRRRELGEHVAENTYEDLRNALHSTLPHEFFTPLAGILGLAELLRQDLDHLGRDEMLGMIRDIERSGRRLHRTLSNYLRLLDLEPDPAPVPPLDPQTAWDLVSAAAMAAAERRDRAADLRLEGSPQPLPISAQNLSTIVEELADNAFSYSRAGTLVTIELGADQGQWTVRVADKGRGMTEQQLQRIGLFHQFDRTTYEQQGLGLGLALVKRLVEAHGGSASIVSSPGTGTIVTLAWPQRGDGAGART